MIEIKEVQAKNILNKSKVFDYCLNPYTGCQISCAYCYARLFMRRYSGHKEPWGQFVDVKVNAPELLKKQLEKTKKGTVWISSVCDPYQPLEINYRLTRKCLEILVEKQFPLNIQTKSRLVLRDIDLLQQFHDIEVGFTITTDDENIARIFESRASPVKERLNALTEIHGRGIKTFAFIGPLLPGNPEKLIASLEGITDKIYIDRMNYINTIRGLYDRLGLNEARTESFFLGYRRRLIKELKKRGMKFIALF